jgi:hypothetical protein
MSVASSVIPLTFPVIPAKAGIHLLPKETQSRTRSWIPAFAGMTALKVQP